MPPTQRIASLGKSVRSSIVFHQRSYPWAHPGGPTHRDRKSFLSTRTTVHFQLQEPE